MLKNSGHENFSEPFLLASTAKPVLERFALAYDEHPAIVKKILSSKVYMSSISILNGLDF